MTRIKIASFGLESQDTDCFFNAFSKEQVNCIPSVNILENE
jgi:hypothetical protein